MTTNPRLYLALLVLTLLTPVVATRYVLKRIVTFLETVEVKTCRHVRMLTLTENNHASD